MEESLLLAEFIVGLDSYYDGSMTPKSEEEMLFFLEHEHQLASDDNNYPEFERCFPNFFKYREYKQTFVDWVNTPEE